MFKLFLLLFSIYYCVISCDFKIFLLLSHEWTQWLFAFSLQEIVLIFIPSEILLPIKYSCTLPNFMIFFMAHVISFTKPDTPPSSRISDLSSAGQPLWGQPKKPGYVPLRKYWVGHAALYYTFFIFILTTTLNIRRL